MSHMFWDLFSIARIVGKCVCVYNHDVFGRHLGIPVTTNINKK